MAVPVEEKEGDGTLVCQECGVYMLLVPIVEVDGGLQLPVADIGVGGGVVAIAVDAEREEELWGEYDAALAQGEDGGVAGIFPRGEGDVAALGHKGLAAEDIVGYGTVDDTAEKAAGKIGADGIFGELAVEVHQGAAAIDNVLAASEDIDCGVFLYEGIEFGEELGSVEVGSVAEDDIFALGILQALVPQGDGVFVPDVPGGALAGDMTFRHVGLQ